MSLKSQELFTHSVGNGMILFVEREVEKFDFTNFEVVPREMFSTTKFPKATLKSGSIVFNVFAIQLLDDCTHIQIFVHPTKKSVIVKACAENDENAVQWCNVDKHGKVSSRKITDATPIYKALKWDEKTNAKMSGALDKCGDHKMVVFHRYD